MRKSKIYISCFLFLVSCVLYGQTPQKIKFSKSSSMIYFFQAGEKQDTIIKNKSDLFYLWVPDTLKEVIVITVDNAQFQKTDTDSLIKLVYVPGLKYESFYFKQKDPDPDESDTLPYEFRTHVNGAVTGDKNKILIQIYNKKENKLILENLFFFRRE